MAVGADVVIVHMQVAAVAQVVILEQEEMVVFMQGEALHRVLEAVAVEVVMVPALIVEEEAVVV